MNKARFFDGSQGHPQDVLIEADNGYLRLRGATTNIPIRDWPAEMLDIVSRPGGGLQGTLTCRLEPDCRVVVSDAVWKEQLEPLLRQHRKIGVTNGVLLWTGVVMACVGLLLAAIFYSPAALDEIAKNVPENWESQLGTYAADSLTAGKRCTANPVADAALQRVFKQMDIDHGDFTIYVSSDDEINALTVPGNNMILLQGLLTAVPTQGQLAAVMAHETGHAYYRHPLRMMVETMGGNILLGLITGNSGLMTNAVTAANQVVLLRGNRAFEAQADSYGMAALVRNGLPPVYLSDFLKTMPHQELEKNIPEWLLTHPNTENRIKLMHDELLAHPPEITGAPKAPLFSDAEWHAIKHYCGDTPDDEIKPEQPQEQPYGPLVPAPTGGTPEDK
ncbi:MAG: M48 family metallopeptidase [Micavibrio sp.]|nr:M48 family metallopeptidase [Micavibrio sp.]